MFPEVLSPLQKELKSCHDKLSHLHPKPMFRLAKLGVISSRFLDLKDYVNPCASCIFGTASKSQWITKGYKYGSIRKDTENKPVASVSVDQLRSDQL